MRPRLQVVIQEQTSRKGVEMANIAAARPREAVGESALRLGSWLMGLAAVGFIGYAVIFFVRNFTDSFLDLGIGHNEVNVGKDQILQFSPSLYHYISHLHIAVAGVHRRDGAGGPVPGGLRRQARLRLGLGGRGRCSCPGIGGGPTGALPEPLRHPRSLGADLPGDGDLRGGGTADGPGALGSATNLTDRSLWR